MPVTVDHDVRRREVAEAVWRVLADTGFAGLSLRAVAREMGATTGLLTHYFASKGELVRHALDVVHDRTAPRMAAAGEGRRGLDGLRARLRAVLVDEAIAAGELAAGRDRETVVDVLTAFTHGLVVQALFDPERFPAERQYAVLDELLTALG